MCGGKTRDRRGRRGGHRLRLTRPNRRYVLFTQFRAAGAALPDKLLVNVLVTTVSLRIPKVLFTSLACESCGKVGDVAE